MAVINTLLGKQDVSLFTPDPESILLVDLIWGMKKEGRYANHTLLTWTVLRHSLLAALIAEELGYEPAICRATLFHDAPEAYTNDIPKPLKEMVWPLLGPIERRLEKAIMVAMELPGWFHPDSYNENKDKVKYVDYLAYHGEVKYQGLRCPLKEVPEDVEHLVMRMISYVGPMPDYAVEVNWKRLDKKFKYFERHAQ